MRDSSRTLRKTHFSKKCFKGCISGNSRPINKVQKENTRKFSLLFKNIFVKYFLIANEKQITFQKIHL